MTKLIHHLLSFITFALFLVSTHTLASEAYIGQFLYQYEGGNTYRVTALNEKEMQWECIEGSEKGVKGIETPERFKINQKVYFATWVEKTSINVSQVIDYKSMKVYSTIIDGNDRYVLNGKVVREK